MSRECYLSEIIGDVEQGQREQAHLAVGQALQNLRMRSLKTRKEPPSARRRLGERDLPGRRKSRYKSLKVRKPVFSAEAGERMQARDWWERVLERQGEVSPD